jgi:hypothetical protein
VEAPEGAPRSAAPAGRRRPGRRSVLRRSAAALLLAAVLVAALAGGDRLRTRLRVERQEDEVVALVRTERFEEALAEREKLESLDPGSSAARLLGDYAGAAGALRSLRDAVSALDSSELPQAARALQAASSFRPQDGTLQVLARRIDERSMEDPIRRELVHPSRWVRAAALYRLRLEINAGERPVDDARLAVRALDAGDPAVTRGVVEDLALLPQSGPLLETFHVGEGGPEVRLDGETFRLLCEALESKLDPPATEFLCGLDFSLCEVLDEAPRPIAVPVPPNLRVDLEPDAPADFRARWLRVMARTDPGELLGVARRAAVKEDLVADLVAALEATGSPEALSALTLLARDHYLTAGHRALRALSSLGAYAALLRIAESDLPQAYRTLALEFLGSEYSELCRDELSTIALRSPEPSLRRIAFRHAVARCNAAAAQILPRALGDPALKSLALEALHRLPARLSGPISVRLLDSADPVVRSHATAILAAEAKGFESWPLLLRLLSKSAETREAAWALLLWRDDLAAFPRIMRILLEAPEATPLERAALAEEGLAALGELLPPSWLERANDAILRIQAACENTAARLLARMRPFPRGTGR